MRTRWTPALIPGVLGTLIVGACGGSGEQVAERGAGAEASRFPGSAVSLDDLGRTVLRALAAGDAAALARVRLTEREHDDVVWPELPAARAEVGFPADYAWENIERRNARDLERVLPWYGDRAPEHVRVECRGGLEEFETFRVHTDCWEVFRVGGGPPLEAQLFKDVLERGGGFKIFRYYADRAPRPSLRGTGVR